MSSDPDPDRATTDTDGGYVHRPDEWDGDDRATGDRPGDGDPEGEGLGRAGWVLVCIVVFAFLVVPGVIYLYPVSPMALGFDFFAAMLVLPFVPALLLGATAVWSLAVGRDRR